MMQSENPTITIEKVENGYIVSIYYPMQRMSEADSLQMIMPIIEKMTNKMTGDDWKNEINNEISEALQAQPPRPFRQFICKDIKEVYKVIAFEEF